MIFSDHYHKKIYERSLELNLWDKIILIEEKNRPWNFIQQQLIQIDFKNIDVLHYFSWGSAVGLSIMNLVSDKTKIILTDEGVGTYYIKERCDDWKKKYLPQRDPIDFNRVSEIWLFDKRLYVSGLNKPLEDIEFKSHLDGDLKFEFRNDLNILFDYEHEKSDWDILFFDQPLTLANITTYNEERSLLINILKAAKNFNTFIKNHPSDYDNKYAGLGANIFKCSNIPWEIVYLNEYIQNNSDLENKIYMTYNSSALLNTRIIFKDSDYSNHFIGLSKLLRKFINEPQLDILFQKYYEQFKQFYGSNYYEVESIEELSIILNKINRAKSRD